MEAAYWVACQAASQAAEPVLTADVATPAIAAVTAGDCGGCQSGCTGRGMYPGPLASMRMQRQACGSSCGDCDQPRVGMGNLAIATRKGMRRGMNCDSCGQGDCGCETGGKLRGRMENMKGRMAGVKGRMAGMLNSL